MFCLSRKPHGLLNITKKRTNIRFLAEKVETYEEFIAAKDAGFELFQGYFFSKPEMLQRKSLKPSALTAIRLLKEICVDEVNYDKVEEIIATDVSLSYKITASCKYDDFKSSKTYRFI